MAVISIQVCSLGIQGMGSRIAGGGGVEAFSVKKVSKRGSASGSDCA